MPSLKPVFLKARDLSDAWFQAIDKVLLEGRKWKVTHGSYTGQYRWELDFVTIHITYPGTRPLLPEMPVYLSHIPPPATEEYIDEYLLYLMTNQPLKENEQYNYGERIAPQMERIISRYLEYGFGSNQECIAVARPEDIDLEDPPCLRQIDTRIHPVNSLREGEQLALHFVIYFRSWDLWGGFPVNLAAIRKMQEYMAMCIGVVPGEMIVSSKGLHIYQQVFNIAKLRVNYGKG